jgi:hypothetical protein
VARIGVQERCVQAFLGETWEKEPLGRSRHRWGTNIKKYLQEIGWDGMDWVDLAQDRERWRTVVNTVMNLRVP